MKAIDIHAHIFSRVNGHNNKGTVVSEHWGRVINGGTTEPFMPPLSDHTSFCAENLLEMMRRSEVEKAVLLQNPTIGCINGEIMDAVERYPDVFAGVIQVDPFGAGAVRQMEELADTGRVRALKLEMSDDWGWLAVHPCTMFHYETIYPLIRAAASKGLHVIIDTGATRGTAYLPEEFKNMVREFGGTYFIFEHMGYLTPGGDREKHRQLLKLGTLDNVRFGISAMGQLLAEEYPCPTAISNLREAYEIMGPDKLLWGSDCPTTLNRYTYQQMKDMVEFHALFLTEEDKKKILYHNGNKLFFDHGMNGEMEA